jgi:CRISPR-associated protein Csy1
MTDQADLVGAQQAFAAGDYLRAQQLALSHLRKVPTSLPAQGVLANASNALQNFAQAMAALEVLHTALPRDAAIQKALAMACNNRGSQLYHAGDLDGAAVLYERATQLDDAQVLAWTNLAACAALRRKHELAVVCYRRLLAFNAQDIDAAIGLAKALRALGQEQEADAALDAIATTAGDGALALEFERIGAPERAAAIFATGDPHFGSKAHALMAQMQEACGNFIGARRNFTCIAQHAGGDARTLFRAERDAALAMPAIFTSPEDLAAARTDYARRMQQFLDDWPPTRLASRGVGLDDLSHPRLRVAYQGGDDLPLARSYGAWLAASASHVSPNITSQHAARPIRRVGLVSARWTQSTIAAYFGTWPGALRADGLEIYLYSYSKHEDIVSRGIAAQVDHAARLPDDLASAAHQLRADQLDLLIYPEIGLDGSPEVLAALRLAPRQWAAWGHPVTTGLPTIDCYLSVATMEPANAQDDYAEPLALLPGIGTQFPRAPQAVPAARESLGLPAGGALYLVPHPPVKLHPDTDEVIAGILRRDRAARVVFIDDEIPALTRLHRRRIENRLATAGIEYGQHLFWLPRQSTDGFRALIASADIVIDALHFSGGATTLDTLAQNTPIVTVEGRYMRGRQTAAMLRMLELPDLICADANAAAARAVEIAQNTDERARLHARLIERTPLLFEQTEPLRALCALVREASAAS